MLSLCGAAAIRPKLDFLGFVTFYGDVFAGVPVGRSCYN